jgi:hypothetical protein
MRAVQQQKDAVERGAPHREVALHAKPAPALHVEPRRDVEQLIHAVDGEGLDVSLRVHAHAAPRLLRRRGHAGGRHHDAIGHLHAKRHVGRVLGPDGHGEQQNKKARKKQSNGTHTRARMSATMNRRRPTTALAGGSAPPPEIR